MSDLPNRLEGAVTTATADNSTTLKIALAAQKRWRVAAAISAAVSTIGFSLTTVPALLVPGLVAGGVGALAAIVFSAVSGAELDEKAISAVAERVATVLEKRKP